MRSSAHPTRLLVAVIAAAAVTWSTTSAATALPQPVTPPQAGARAILDAQHHPATEDPTRATGPGVYIVTLTAPPSASYPGGVPGYPATRARQGERFDRTRPAVQRYEQRLTDKQHKILDAIGDPEVLYRYTTAVDGFAVDLTPRQVKTLRAAPGVALVEKSSKQRLDGVSSPNFLGAEKAWAATGGPEHAGKGTVIGVIDSGIWPENPSFAGIPQRTPGRSKQMPRFHGACQPGQQWDANDCNDKVISARYYVRGFGKHKVAESEYLSPRDGSGHGSHTASIAAGNHGVAVEIQTQDFGLGSGMAPAARIAAYKACWTAPNPDDDGCTTPDTVAAIDQAVADGVDVIDYAVSGSQDTVADSVELAFLNATASGVFVAASAGNDGPAAGTAAHPSPWVTTVGASTHHLFQGSIVLGDADRTSFVGAMVSDDVVPSTHVVLSSDVAAPGVTTEDAQICEIGALDATLVQDNIVVCDRGTTARVDKSAAVSRAGGAAMVLANVTPDSVEADFHSVPTVHVDVAAGDAIKEYVQGAGPDATASINPTGADRTTVPQIASFSSRGPSPAAEGGVLKPDITAPGVSIVSAVAPPSNSGRMWDLDSGTSMSAAHIAGLAAFVQGERPDWSPAEIKSAMMTTATPLKGTAGPFAEGSGNVNPSAFLHPGLVLDTHTADYVGFLAGQGYTNADGSPVTDDPIDASALNLPSIAVSDLTRPESVTRKFTNLGSAPKTFTASVTGLDGIGASVQPRQLTVGGGKSRKVTITFTPGDAPPGSYLDGELLLTNAEKKVRIPVVVRPGLVDAPTEVTGTAGAGESSLTINGVAGTDDPVELTTSGLVYATPTGVTLVPGPFDPTAPDDDTDTFEVPVTIPDYTDVARFQMDGHNAGDDLDIYVYRDGELVAQSASASADETVTMVEPESGDYTVYVNSRSAANGSTTTGQFYSWVVGQSDADNLKLSRDSVVGVPGGRFSVRASWDDLDSSRWFGAIRYGDSARRTLVTIN